MKPLLKIFNWMKNNNILKLRLLLIMTTILAISFNSCQKEDSFPLNTQQQEQNETFVLVQKAKDWFEQKSLQAASESNIDFNLNDYEPDWNTFAIDTNSTGDRVINISLVKDKKSQSDSAFYTQMSVLLNKANVVSGVIKEYMDNPYQGESEIRLYIGSGKLLAKGVYQSRTGKMKLKTTFAKSFKAVSSGGNPNGGKLMWEAEVGENVNGSGIWLDEVVITDTYEPPPAWEPETPYDPPIDPGIPVDPGSIGGSGGGGGGSRIYVVDDTIKQKYPKFADLIQQIPLFLSANPKVMDALVQFTGFTEAQIQTIITDGQGPTLTLSNDPRLDIANGLFNGLQDANNILISESSVQLWENKTGIGSFAERSGLAFSIMVTVLHETVHYGRFHNGLPDPSTNPDYGTDFEELGFGFNVQFQTNQPVRYTLYMLNP